MVDLRHRYPTIDAHWRNDIDGAVATWSCDVDEDRGLRPGISSSSIRTISASTSSSPTRCSGCASSIRGARVVITSAQGSLFLLGRQHLHARRVSHAWKVNFCKFTNETRNGIEDASAIRD
jgi:benzoyl-CoA-dihydrodiol lyase